MINDVCVQLVSFGAGILSGIDPNPENFVCASILHTSAHQVGCLMRLEPNKQVQASSPTLLCCSCFGCATLNERCTLNDVERAWITFRSVLAAASAYQRRFTLLPSRYA